PVKPVYAPTIYNSLRHTLTRVGIDLPGDIFAHGQLYVVLNRAQGHQHVKCLTPADSRCFSDIPTVNIAYS
ncbi:unnamed protein product, partial [Discosporangium mesarthrocarpum]